MKKYILFCLILAVSFLFFNISKSFADQGCSYWINPAYKHLFEDDQLFVFKGSQRSTPKVCYSFDEILPVLKEKFENRVEQFSIQIIYNFNFDDVSLIMDQAFDEAVSGDDYLYFNIGRRYLSWRGCSGDVIVNYSATYLTTYEEEQKVSQKVTEVLLDIISQEMNDEEKEKAIHDWIVLNVEFDLTGQKYSAYAALFLGHTVCQGYSLLAYKMLNQAEISARIIDSQAINHAWNMVYICGNWYHLDITWDDPVPDVSGRVLYDYYNKSDEEIQSGTEPHYGWDTSKFPEAPVSYVEGVCSSKLAGDVNHQDGINLQDVILSLQIASGIQILSDVYTDADVNGDNKIGIEEAIFSLQYVAYSALSKLK